MRIEVDGVRVEYASGRGREPVLALDGVSFEVGSGAFVALLGPSGCGKSTLLAVVAGLMAPSAGEVRFVEEGGRPAAGGDGMGAGQALSAVVFQEFALFPWRTVMDNVTFGLEVRGVGSGARREAGRRYLEMVGLGSVAQRLPAELSGGMKQRVGIARALAVEPRVLLMDEPLSALDAQTRALLQQDLLQLWERTGKTVLYVTHNIEEAAFLSDRVVVLSRRPGRVKAEVVVPFGRPRDEGLLATGEFAAFVQRLWGLLREDARLAMWQVDGLATSGVGEAAPGEVAQGGAGTWGDAVARPEAARQPHRLGQAVLLDAGRGDSAAVAAGVALAGDDTGRERAAAGRTQAAPTALSPAPGS
ncbi:ABC transporter ATP-binding protein [Geochorda subterranea]|uniref:ABC transporter ATP-binding protein n=1 Tax=Geochorda subterranea TaxID=3109564 RepID=A0ABZ1BLQ1_9FIRM|nr:ABC transporter ATP-binding protein [Limnochorda sp. LNt]WRP13751.1 ABC transporter ATP-binding protein [Limnochorda sp. LNt]